jgi:hypothetical protein
MDRLIKILQDLQYFTSNDLATNQKGLLSRPQRVRYVVSRLIEHLLGGLAVFFVVVIVIHILQLNPDNDAVSAIIGALAILSLILFAIRVRSAFEARVKLIRGRVAKRVIWQSSDWPLFAATVGRNLFYIPLPLYETLEEDGLYNAYYLERSPRVGGSILLSAEQLESGREFYDDEEGDED